MIHIIFVSSGSGGLNRNLLADKQAESLVRKNVKIMNFYINGKGIGGYLSESGRLRDTLAQGCNLIHAHYGWCGVSSYLAKLFSNTKLVVSFMGDDLIGEVGNNGKYTVFGYFTAILNMLLARYVYDYSIVKSRALANRLLNGTRYEIIPNGVDLNQFYPIDKYEARRILNLDQNKLFLLFASDPERNEKNYPLSRNSIEKLRREDVELLVIYDKSTWELNLYYCAVDCLIFSSIHEGSPNVIKEAMACNCPIVSTNVGDVEWVFGQTDGCYLGLNKIEDFSEKILQAIEFSAQIGRTKGRERIIEIGLDSESVANKMIAIYKKLLRKN